MTTFLVLLYSVYMAALVLGGIGLCTGLLPGEAPVALTLVPAALGATVIAIALALPHLAARLERTRSRRLARVAPAAAPLGEVCATRCAWRGAPIPA
jgi:hypothetical protein